MTREGKRNDPREIINKLRQADATLSLEECRQVLQDADQTASRTKYKRRESQEVKGGEQADPFRSFQQFCSGHYQQAAVVGGKLPDAADFDPKVWQRDWFDSASTGMDAYLRSPFYLEMMKRHVDALIRNRQGLAHGGLAHGGLAHFAESSEQNVPVPFSRPESQTARFREAAATPYDVVFQAEQFRLLRYQSEVPSRLAEPALICFALVNRPYILDLQADRSVVRQLLAIGLDVYLIDWGIPTADDHTLRLCDYVCNFLKQAVDWVCGQSGSPSINLLGYCMGGTMSTMFTALNPQQIRNLILMAAPIDFGGDEGLLNVWAKEEYFDVDGLIDAYGNCPGWFLQSCFQLMKPIQNFAEKYITLCEKMNDDAFLENFLAMERWANDNVPVAGETFREYVKKLYRDNRLVKGTMRLDNMPISLRDIVCPLLLLTADSDHLVPPLSTLAIGEHVHSAEVTSRSIDAGHIGLAVSSKAHQRLWPEAAQWIAGHSTTRSSSQAARK